MPLSLGVIGGILCADVLVDLECMTRPYEVNPGQTDRVLKECVEYLYRIFRSRPDHGKTFGTPAWHLPSNYFTRALRDVRRKWDAIEVDRLRVKAKVKITGEYWLQPNEREGNYNVKRWLEQEEGEVVPAPVAVWLHHLLHYTIRKLERRNTVSKYPHIEELALRAAERIYRGTYNRFRHALGDLPNELSGQEVLRSPAAPSDKFEVRGGESHTPIDVKGDSKVHALSRCLMILTEAKKRANTEFEDAMKNTGITVDEIREFEERHPELKRATYKVPHRGCAGQAANYVLHLAFDRGLADGPSPIVRRPNLVRTAAGGILSTPTGATRFRRKLSRLEGMPGPTCPQSGGTTQLATHSWHSQPK